jgi:hypothetical protein
MTLSNIGDLLLEVTPNVYHYEALEQSDSYIVWAEDGQGDSLHVDNKMKNQTIQGTIDYYTKAEFDPAFDLIQETLNSTDLSWKLNSIQWEKETGYTHYEWIFEIDNQIGGD